MGRLARRRSRNRGTRARALHPRTARRQGAPLRRLPSVSRADRVHQHDSPASRGALAGRPGDRSAPALVRALERGRDGAARRQEGPRARRPHRKLRVSGDAVRHRLEPLLECARRKARWRPHLLPGTLRAGRLCARVPRRTPERSAARHVPPGSGRQGHLVLSAPVADAGAMAVPDGLDGTGPDPGDLPGAVPALPRASRHGEDRGTQGVGVHGRRRDGRARVARRDRPRLARKPRQPRLRHQLQPAAARRTGARQRQDHPGARGELPRRRLERDQGDLGLVLGSAHRARQGRHPAEAHGGSGRRRIPEIQEPRWRVRPRTFLRQVPRAQGERRQHVRRGHLAAQPRRPRSAQGVRGVRRGDEAQGTADGHPREDREGLRHGRGRRGKEHRAPAEEDAHRGAQAVPRPLRDPDPGRPARGAAPRDARSPPRWRSCACSRSW